MSISNLRKITNGKSVFYNSPFSNTNELVRTGIDMENSFYHSLLLAYAQDYSTSSVDEKNDMVQRFIESITKKVPEDDWEQLNSEYKLISYSSEIMLSLASFYEYIETKKKPELEAIQNVMNKLRIDSNFELYEAIFELLSFSNFKDALRMTNRDSANESLEDYRKIFISNIINILNNSREFKAIDIEKKKYIINIVNNFLVTFFKEFEKQLFQQFKTRLVVVESKVNPFLLSVISRRFKRDIYLIDGTNKLPYSVEQMDDRGRKSILLLRLENSFELIGKILPNKEIGYEFESDNTIIKKLNMFFLHPEGVRNKYPELSQFLSNSVTAKSPRNLYSSDSDEEEDQKAKVKHRRESRSEPRSEPRSESRSEPRNESRSEPRNEHRSEPRSEPRYSQPFSFSQHIERHKDPFQLESKNTSKPNVDSRRVENQSQSRMNLKELIYQSSSEESD